MNITLEELKILTKEIDCINRGFFTETEILETVGIYFDALSHYSDFNTEIYDFLKEQTKDIMQNEIIGSELHIIANKVYNRVGELMK